MSASSLDIVKISRSGTTEVISIKKISDINRMKCDRGSGDVRLIYSWTWNNRVIECYGWCEGDAGMENHFDLPPPVDKKLLFGCLFFSQIHQGRDNLDERCFQQFYNSMMKGFIDLQDSDEEDEEEELSESGSLSGDFIADDNEEIQYSDSSSEEKDFSDDEHEEDEDEDEDQDDEDDDMSD